MAPHRADTPRPSGRGRARRCGRPTEPGPQPGEAAALVAFRTAAPTPNRRTRMFPLLKAAAVAADRNRRPAHRWSRCGCHRRAPRRCPGHRAHDARDRGRDGARPRRRGRHPPGHPRQERGHRHRERRPGRRPATAGRHQGPGGLRARHHHRRHRPGQGRRHLGPGLRGPQQGRSAAPDAHRERHRRDDHGRRRVEHRPQHRGHGQCRPQQHGTRTVPDPDPTRPSRTLHVGASSYRGKCDRLRR